MLRIWQAVLEVLAEVAVVEVVQVTVVEVAVVVVYQPSTAQMGRYDVAVV